jgi:hypothetical protein
VSKAIVVLLAVVGFRTGSVRSTHAENPVLDAVVGTNDIGPEVDRAIEVARQMEVVSSSSSGTSRSA